MKASQVLTQDTIAAIATPLGEGGVAVIRVSGGEAPRILQKLFRPGRKEWESHHLYVGTMNVSEEGRMLDQGMAVWMKAPHSYTGEEVVEFHVHGGALSTHRILETILSMGARLAEAGEFSKRSFLNGKIDLIQAEAVCDLVSAKTELFLQEAQRRLQGGLSQHINALRQSLIQLLAHVEATLDFPEEEGVGEIHRDQAQNQLKPIQEKLKKLVASYEEGRRIREGIRVAIVGRPNVGKSSIFNRLMNFDRAIVTEIPGTTRDTIEEVVSFSGIQFHLADTAGIRSTSNRIEKEGIQRAWGQLRLSDLALIILDGSENLTDEDRSLLKEAPMHRSIVAINKIDLPEKLTAQTLKPVLNGTPVIPISALKGEGMERLRGALVQEAFEERKEGAQGVMITLSRHKVALERGVKSLEEADRALEQGLPLEIVAGELRGALDAIGEVVGVTTNEEVLNEIFRRFCIGK
ncbi:MAG: tRNA uridine-5-carboxymethylaminomethyl(34) synthesis GTPase MnmE [Deltaproteobacteria bacterium]|nr:tRNA uridine-5-carboxymethylaminomethyl(34) synthesis GTPase MnmE [Deltaproteobacteria bacterium]